MRILYDGLIYDLYRNRPGGISNFFDQLISIVSDEYPCMLTSARPAHLPHPSGKHLRTVRFDAPIRPGRLKPFLREKLFSIQSQRFKPDLIHPSYYRDPLSLQNSAPLVYTAFDMIHEKWSAQIDPEKSHAALKYRCFVSASAIPCISKSTQNDLISLYPQLEGKTSVIYLAGGFSEENYCAAAPRISRLKHLDYFLYVGDRRSYKNFTRALLAFGSIHSEYPRLKLKVVGASLSVDEQDLIDALGLEDNLIVLSDVTREQLICLYQESICLVYPSLYEGFGIPILEAMSLAVPVITTATSSIPEVAGDAALYVNPTDIKELRDAMARMLQNPELRSDLSNRGLRRAQLFSWKKTAEQYLELYFQVLSRCKNLG